MGEKKTIKEPKKSDSLYWIDFHVYIKAGINDSFGILRTICDVQKSLFPEISDSRKSFLTYKRQTEENFVYTVSVLRREEGYTQG